MFKRNWLKRHFNHTANAFSKPHSSSRQRPTRRVAGRSLRIETLESRYLLATDLGGDPSAVLPNDSTDFSHAPGMGDYSAKIDLAQNDSHVTTVAVGAGEPSASSVIRYVSPTGGAGAGTEADPWSLDYANHVVQTSETILMLGGTYDGKILPKRGGTFGNPLTYKPAPGVNVHLRAIGSDNAIAIIHDYVLVEGITVSRRDGRSGNSTHVTNVYVSPSSNYVTLRNLHIVYYGDQITQARLFTENGIVSRGSYVLIENNFVEHMKFGIFPAGAGYNVVRGNTIADPVYDGIHLGAGTGAPLNHLIENNVIFGAMISDGITFNGRSSTDPVSHLGINRVIIRNNAIFNNGENNIDLKGTTNILIEGNYLWKSFGDDNGSNVLYRSSSSLVNDEGSGYSIAKGANTSSENIIIRNNVLTDSNQAAIALKGYKVYNNTFLNNRRSYNGPNQSASVPGDRKPSDAGIVGNGTGPNAAILNNIIGDHGYEVMLRTNGGAAIDGNAYYNTYQTPKFSAFVDNYNWTTESFASWQTWLQSTSNFSGDEAHSQVVPGGPASLFVNVPGQVTGDPAQFDFRLKANSPAIDSGVFLTKTVGSGSGTTMTVADAKMFFDGFDITQGDEIQLEGQTQRARITQISGNTLTLDSPLSWTSGTGVSLSYEGSSPDVGAIEFASTPGDFDTDGDVDGSDFLSWQRGFGTTYDAGDLTDWEDNFGASTPAIAAATAAAPLAVTTSTSIEVDASASSASVVLALDLQTAILDQATKEEVFENTFAGSDVLPVDIALALPVKQEGESSTLLDVGLDSTEAKKETKEIADDSLDGWFELFGDGVL